MKKQKWAAVCAALLMATGFSSCLDGENDPTVHPVELMKVNGSMGYYTFESAGGYTVTPTNMSALENVTFQGRYALVQYSYDSSLLEWNEDKNATIENLTSIKDDYAYAQSPAEEDANAPIYAISSQYSNPVYYDKYNLFIPVTYFYKASEDKDELQSELNSHSFALYYDPNDPDAVDGKLLLRLRHKVNDAEVKREETGTEYRHFDLTSILSSYGAEMPEKIVIEFEKSSSASYDQVTSDKTCEIDYKSVFETNNTANNQ